MWGGASKFAQGYEAFHFITLTESFSICAVDVFIIISGYFSIERKNRKIGKVLTLFFWVILYQMVFSLGDIFALEGTTNVIKKIIRCLYPVNYYVYLYSALYLISPFLNQMVENMDFKKYNRMIVILIAVFSLHPTFTDAINSILDISIPGISTVSLLGSQEGYSIINFIMLYLLGGYIRRYSYKYKKYNLKYLSIIIYILSTVVIWIESYFLATNVAWSYCNLFVIIQAVSIFLYFDSLEIKYNRYINYFAESVFGIFLIHRYLLPQITQITGMEKMASSIGGLIGNMFISVSICFMISVLVDILGRKIFGGMAKYWEKTKLYNWKI